MTHRLINRALFLGIGILIGACALTASPANTTYRYAAASWYGPGFYGHRTACGQTLTQRSVFVAALTPSLAKCGLKLTICASQCYRVRVQDRGAYRSDNRAFDIAPGLRQRIGFYGVINVKWKKGWA